MDYRLEFMINGEILLFLRLLKDFGKKNIIFLKLILIMRSFHLLWNSFLTDFFAGNFFSIYKIFIFLMAFDLTKDCRILHHRTNKLLFKLLGEDLNRGKDLKISENLNKFGCYFGKLNIKIVILIFVKSLHFLQILSHFLLP